MNVKDSIGMKGWYEVQAWDKHGRDITDQIKAPNSRMEDGKLIFDNTLTNAGFAEVAGLICADVGGTGWDYCALGTDNTAPDPTDTTLGAEISSAGGSRAAGTGTRQTTTVTNDTFQLVTTFNFTGSLSIEEVGIFNAAADGTMLSHQLLSFGASNGDSLQITFKTKVSA